MRALTVHPIGIIRTPFATVDDCPRNGRLLDPPPPCEACVFPEYGAGLADLRGFTHLMVLYWLAEADDAVLTMIPPFDPVPRGIFATRAPCRPNPIGVSVVAFDGFADTLTLRLRFLDCLDGTPLIDIKPYLPSTDSVPEASMGWLARPKPPSGTCA